VRASDPAAIFDRAARRVIHSRVESETPNEELPVVHHLPVYVGPDAVEKLAVFCAERDLRRLAIIADDNTYRALGERAEAALRHAGLDVLTVILRGADIIADGDYIFQAMLGLDHAPRTLVAVGSGTLTDISRFISHRSGGEFISLPTAASVDGYTSIGAPLVIEGVKTTVNCHGPVAVFADPEVLAAAPRALTAAGLGDMVAKFTSVADWEFGKVLQGEVYDAEIAARMRGAAQSSLDHAGAIAAGTEEGVHALFDGLIESGFGMLDFGATLPASGSEHHISHFLEMKLLREGRHSIYHGAKVGIGVLICARRFERVARMPRAEAAERLAEAPLPNPVAEAEGIRRAYGPMAAQVLEAQQPYLEMRQAEFDALKQNLLDHWDEVQRIAATVPPAAELERWIRDAGGPVVGREVGLSDEEMALALHYSHYLKDRITINRISLWLGLP
jgi:glycerol-1-phosphate dehydrogenase [NAD(P)+]